jgi:hypothetical protein
VLLELPFLVLLVLKELQDHQEQLPLKVLLDRQGFKED